MHGIGGVHHIPNPCMYSGHFGDNKEKYLEQFDDVIDLNIGKNGLAGFWAGESFILILRSSINVVYFVLSLLIV